MKQLKLTFATTTAAMLLSALVASATDQGFGAAAVCGPGSLNGEYIRFMLGAMAVNTLSGSPAEVECAVGQDNGTDTNDDLLVYYYDMDPASSHAASVNCQVTEMWDDGTIISSVGTRYGCSTVGGCSNWPNPGWTGTGSIRFTDVQHGNTSYMVARCRIPSASAGQSAIISLTVDEQ